MKKVAAILLAFAMVFGIALTVQAQPPTFSISITSVTGGPGSDPGNNTYTNPISLSGIASATHFPGLLSQYQVQIEWGDGVVDIDSNVNFTQSGDDFSGTWTSDPSHTYTNGTYTIMAKLYHQQPPGNEAGDAQAAPIIIVVINTPPLAVDDSASTDEDIWVTVDVLANDSDVDGDPLTVASVTQGSNGSVTNNGINVTYSPNSNWNGNDTFTYTASDGNGGYDTATVTVTVNAVNDPPVAVYDSASTDEDTPVTIDVLDNDSDVDGDTLTVDSVTQGSNGSVTNNGINITYYPNFNWNGNDTFTYTASDGNGGTDTATVTVTVTSVNNAPVVSGIPDQTVAEGATFATINLDDYVSDVDNSDAEMVWTYSGRIDLSVTIVGRVATIGTPSPDWNGSETITFTATDPGALSDSDSATFTVTPVNDAPLAVDDAYSMDEDTTLNVLAPGVLANDSDVEGDKLTAVLAGNVSNGALTLSENGSFTYTPNANFYGFDSFSYKAYDGSAYSDNATVTITVNAVADGGGGGGGGVGIRYLTVDFEGEITRGPITYDGRLLVDLAAPSPDGMHLLELDKGTQTLDSEGEVVTLIVIRAVEAPSLPTSTVLVGSAYDFGPSGITFDQPVKLTLSYNATELPEDTLAVIMDYYSTEGVWIEMETESSQVAEIGSLTGNTNHFTIFGLFAAVPSFEVSDLSIVPSQREIWAFPTFVVRTGEEALVSINVANTGDREATYTATLWVDGEISATQEVTITPGQSKVVVFTLSGNEPGRYMITVDDLSGELISSVWINWWLIGIIAAALLLIILFTVWSYRRRGKTVD